MYIATKTKQKANSLQYMGNIHSNELNQDMYLYKTDLTSSKQYKEAYEWDIEIVELKSRIIRVILIDC